MFKICRLKNLLAVVFLCTVLELSFESRPGVQNNNSMEPNGHNSAAAYYQQQVIIEHPNDQQAKIGETVLLKCRIRTLRGEPQWCIDDFCLGLAKKTPNRSSSFDSSTPTNRTDLEAQHLKGRPRYRIVGDRARGEFNLLIEPVQLQDNMFFYCMATAASETIKAVKSKKAFLTVLTYPKSLHLDSPVHLSLNKPSSIRCVAHQSRPPVRLLIAINGELITDELKYTTEILEMPTSHAHHQQYHYHSEHFLPPFENLNNTGQGRRRYSLMASSPNALSIPAESLRSSYYDTYTNVTIDDISMTMQGQLVECFAFSFLVHNLTHPSPLNQLNRLNHFHSDLMSTKSSIQVDYAPEVNLKIIQANRLLKEQDVISLVCETKATPPIHSYRWFIGKNHLNGVKDQNLNLKLRKEMHLKTVTCEASNSVASVKASIQLNILFNPTFIRGTKTFIQVDKSACNKPLTLNCDVTSNPASNITWYRRRLNRVYVEHLRAALEQQDSRHRTTRFLSSIESLSTRIRDGKIIKEKPTVSLEHSLVNGDLYEDELVGSGPTYTIASFNCANLVRVAKNSSKVDPESTARFKRNFPNELASQETIYSDSTEISTFRPEQIDEIKNSIESEDGESDYFYEFDDDYENSAERSKSSSQSSDILSEENSDFGVYVCEARNQLSSHEAYENAFQSSPYFSNVIRRHIKLNPAGPPVSKTVTSATSQMGIDELVGLLMRTSPAHSFSLSQQENSVEVVASMGESVSLTCLVEPLPRVERLVWIKDSRKVMANSDVDTSLRTTESSKALQSGEANDESQWMKGRKAAPLNIKVKFENLSLYGTKQGVVFYDGEDHEFYQRQSSQKILDEIEGISSTDGQNLALLRSVLSIKSVRKQDFGVYKCKASNQLGSRVTTIVLRERTLIDKIRFNSHVSFVLLVFTIVIMISLFFLLLMCAISKRTRHHLCCCCCFCFTKPSALKKKKLLSENLHCDLTSEKKISDWLASSKLSNDTTTTTATRNGSLLAGGPNSKNSSSTTTTTTTTALIDVITATSPPFRRNSGKSPAHKKISYNNTFPSKMNAENLALNCAVVADEYDNYESQPIESFRIPTMKSHQFDRFLVSSPLTTINLLPNSSAGSAAIEKKNVHGYQIDHINLDENEPMNSSSEESATNATTSTVTNNHASPARKITPTRSHFLANGNFNAKITTSTNSNTSRKPSATIVSTPSLNEISERISSRKAALFAPNGAKEASKGGEKNVQEASSRLSELLNELSPGIDLAISASNSGQPSGASAISSLRRCHFRHADKPAVNRFPITSYFPAFQNSSRPAAATIVHSVGNTSTSNFVSASPTTVLASSNHDTQANKFNPNCKYMNI